MDIFLQKKEEKLKFHRYKEVGLIIGMVLAIVIWMFPIRGLSQTGSHAFAVAVFVACSWIFAVMPPAIPAIFACVIYYVLSVAHPADAFAGFISPSIWMLFFALVIAKGVESSGLGKRIANLLILRGAMSFNGLVLVFIILCIVFPFIIPSTTAIVTLNMSLAVGIVEALNLDRESRAKISTGLTCFIAVFALTSGRGILTGSIQNMITPRLLYSITGVQISWMEWLYNMWIIIPIRQSRLIFISPEKYQPEKMLSSDELRQKVKQNLAEMGPITGKELKVLFLVLGAVLMWTFDSYIPLDTNQIGILQGCYSYCRVSVV